MLTPSRRRGFHAGEDLKDRMIMGHDIFNIAIEERTKARTTIPAPSDMEAVTAWADAQKGDPDLGEGTFLIQLFRAPVVDMTPVRMSVSFPKSTLEETEAKAMRAGFTKSGFPAYAAQQRQAYSNRRQSVAG